MLFFLLINQSNLPSLLQKKNVFLVAQACLTLCDPMDCSLPGSSVHGILQARILERVAFPPPGDLPDTGIKPMSLVSLTLAGGFFTTSATWHPYNLI